MPPTSPPAPRSVWIYVTDLRLFLWAKRTDPSPPPLRAPTYDPFLGLETAAFLSAMLGSFLGLLALCKLRRCLRERWRTWQSARQAPLKAEPSPSPAPSLSPRTIRALLVPVRRLSRSHETMWPLAPSRGPLSAPSRPRRPLSLSLSQDVTGLWGELSPVCSGSSVESHDLGHPTLESSLSP